MTASKTAQIRRETPAAFMSRFGRNKAGNTIAMFAMALIPMIAMTGSAVDIGRSYLVKTRLQQACDAGVLAGRRAMASGTYGTAERAQATSYFNTNMRNGSVGGVDNWYSGATNVTFTTSAGTGNEVLGSATARVPVTLMKMFGYEQLDLNVSCNARLDVSNTDVVMVLDVTGSMDDCPDGSSACNGQNNNKIAGLRTAVTGFYNTIRAATGTNTRFRIGFVPYSSTVNLSTDPFTGTQILPSGWVVSNWTYQSRVANMDLPGWSGSTVYSNWTTQTFSGPISNSNCNNYGNNVSFNQSPYSYSAASGWNAPIPGNDVFQDSDPSQTTTQSQRVTASYSGNRTCQRQIRTATSSYARTGRFGFRNWTYKPVSYNVSSYRAGNVVNVYTANTAPSGTVATAGAYNMVDLVNDAGSTVTGVSTTFEGCYEERSTVNQSSFSSIPSTAYDMLHGVTPTNNDTQWRPIWGEIVYNRSSTAEETTGSSRSPVGATCPDTVASKLADRSLTDVTNYVNTLSPAGNTYHDLGMAWGLRFASANGIWGSENTTAPNGNPISRHIIFMTDGDMNTPQTTYSSHGYERLDLRTGTWGASTSTMNSIHSSRFIAMCNAARADGISVWTVAFGTSNPPTLVSCADPGQAFVATDSAALQTQFQLIASRIAQLRLSQ